MLANAPADVIDAFKALPPMMRAFALALPVSPSQQAAALAAGYAKTTARKKAHDMAADPKVRKIVDWCCGQAVQRTVLDIERLHEEIAAIAFSDPRKLFDEKGNVRNMHDLDDLTAKAVSGFEFADGPNGFKQKVTLWDKLSAIEKALKLLNAYPEKKEQAPSAMIVGVVVVPEKGLYKHPERQAIEGVATKVTRTDPHQSKGKAFKVTSAG